MRWTRFFFTPIVAFIGLQVVLGVMVFLWIYWVRDRHRILKQLALSNRSGLTFPGADWMVLTAGLSLMLAVLAGVCVLFIFWRRQSKLYRQQQQLIAQITHELKSPLASIQLHLETIRLRGASPELLPRFLDTMLDDADRLNTTISKLLMAARIEQRRGPRELIRLDLSSLVEKICSAQKSKLPDGSLLEHQVTPGIHILGDRDDLEVVLSNLLENAALYTTAPPIISVDLERSDRSCLLSVRDHGEGIDPKELKQVFRRFYRADSANLNRRGTGLGLYIVRSIIQDHHGTITAHSEGHGTGTVFRITLPLAPQQNRSAS